MSLYSGVTGQVKAKIGGGADTAVAHINNFSVDISVDLAEVASLGRPYKEKVPGIKDWKAKADGAADFGTGGQKPLLDAMDAGTPIEASFYLGAGTYFKGDAYIDAFSTSLAADGTAQASISLSGTGGVILTADTVPTELGELDVTSVAGAVQGGTVLAVTPESPGASNSYIYKLGTAYISFSLGDILSAGWTAFTTNEIAAGTATKVTVAEVVTATGAAVGRGIATLVKKA